MKRKKKNMRNHQLANSVANKNKPTVQWEIRHTRTYMKCCWHSTGFYVYVCWYRSHCQIYENKNNLHSSSSDQHTQRTEWHSHWNCPHRAKEPCNRIKKNGRTFQRSFTFFLHNWNINCTNVYVKNQNAVRVEHECVFFTHTHISFSLSLAEFHGI